MGVRKEKCGGNQERRPRGVVRANHESHSPASDRGPAEVSLWGLPWSATRGPDPMSPHPTRERRVEVSKEKKRKVGGGSQERRPRGVVRANHESHSPASDRGPAEVSLWGLPWSATRGPDPMSPHPTRERRVEVPRKRSRETQPVVLISTLEAQVEVEGREDRVVRPPLSHGQDEGQHGQKSRAGK